MAAKIKDALFIGDAETSQSEVFINDNKISNLINLAGRDVPNVWASHGLVYLTYNWEDRPDYRLFTGHEDSMLTDIMEFVDVSISHGISVLMFSKRGTGRCIIAACLYLMVKYRWGFEKAYDYVYSKKPDIDLNKGFIQQMFALDMKLLAARQKAYALKHSIENGFRIEPNMTINDIAAMLPLNEAKRWNSWDPSYLLVNSNRDNNNQNQNSHPNKDCENQDDTISWQKYSDNVIATVKKKDYSVLKATFLKQKMNVRSMDDMEEEMVLIFSFVNSKNTINALPGPYLNAYDIPKHYRIKFDTILFEEDVNLFPAPPLNSRYAYPPKGILKGVSSNSEATTKMTDGEKVMKKQQAESVKQKEEKSSSSIRTMPPTSATLQNSNNNISGSSITPNGTAMAGRTQSHNMSSVNNASSNNVSDDLFKFVGITAQSQSKEGKVYTGMTENKKLVSGEEPHHAATTFSSNARSDDDRKAPLSAEERLRKLMADMQKQNFFPDHLRAPESGHITESSSANNSRSTASYVQMDSGLTTNEAPYYSQPSPSLYDLANMHVQSSMPMNDAKHSSDSTSTTKIAPSGMNLRSSSNNTGQTPSSNPASGLQKPTVRSTSKGAVSRQGIVLEDLETDASSFQSDPLAAFEPANAVSLSASNQPTPKGVLRARHDILGGTAPANYTMSSATSTNLALSSNNANSTSRPLATNGTSRTSRQAWGASGSTPTASSTARPSSPIVGPSVGGSGGIPGTTTSRQPSTSTRMYGNTTTSSNASVSSIGSNSSAMMSGANPTVGAGATTSSKVYRHGSPANSRPTRTSLTVGRPSVSTTASVTNNIPSNLNMVSAASLTSLASNGSAGNHAPSGGYGGTNGSGRYSSPYTAQTRSSSQRYSSASNTTSSSGPTAQRRGSISSQASLGSMNSNSSQPAPSPQPSYQSSAVPQQSSASDARKKATNASPMRASYSGRGTTSSSRPSSPYTTNTSNNNTGFSSTVPLGLSSRRFSTPTPQSGQHHDFDNNSLNSTTNSNNPLSSTTSRGNTVRSSTPSKTSWKF